MRYEPLRQFLSSLSEPAIVLSYEEIEKLLGRPLPPTAYGDSWRQWWANTETHSQALAWLRAGWRVTRPDLANRVVEFTRTTDATPAGRVAEGGSSRGTSSAKASPAGTIAVSRDDLIPSALRMIEDAAEEAGHDIGRAVAELLNRAAMARRRELLGWFTENAPRTGTRSVELIREDRDAR